VGACDGLPCQLALTYECLTCEDMAKTSTLTVRMDPDLLEALKMRAKRLGRSTSAEVVRLLQQEIAVVPRSAKAGRPSMGMFAHLETPTLEELSATRRTVSASIAKSVRAKAKRA
jgi:plasmid stability protein